MTTSSLEQELNDLIITGPHNTNEEGKERIKMYLERCQKKNMNII